MIEVNTEFNKVSLSKMFKKNKKLPFTLSVILSVLILVCGVVNIIAHNSDGKEIFIGIVLIVVCPVPVAYSIFSNKSFLASMIKSFGVEVYPMYINFKFPENEVLIEITQNGKSKINRISYDYIYKFENKKELSLIYLDKTRAFMMSNDGFASGSRKELTEFLISKGVLVKGKTK